MIAYFEVKEKEGFDGGGSPGRQERGNSPYSVGWLARRRFMLGMESPWEGDTSHPRYIPGPNNGQHSRITTFDCGTEPEE